MGGVKRFAIIHPPEIVTANHLHGLIVFKVSHSGIYCQSALACLHVFF